MGFLVLTRNEGEELRLTMAPGASPERLLQHLIRDGITIHIKEARHGKAAVAVEAPREILVLREELT
jgi:sRNA-binding carbon storage regulator CsrA